MAGARGKLEAWSKIFPRDEDLDLLGTPILVAFPPNTNLKLQAGADSDKGFRTIHSITSQDLKKLLGISVASPSRCIKHCILAKEPSLNNLTTRCGRVGDSKASGNCIKRPRAYVGSRTARNIIVKTSS